MTRLNQILIALVILALAFWFSQGIKKTPPQSIISSWAVLSGTLSGGIDTWIVWTGSEMSGFLSQNDKDITDVTGNTLLIRKFYSALQTHDFQLASSLIVSGENTAAGFEKKYKNLVSIIPYKIEQVGERAYQYYVRYIENGSGGVKQESIFSVKKLIMGGKLQTVGGDVLQTNAENAHFRYYSDPFIQVSKESFTILNILTPEFFTQSKCVRSSSKNADYFKKLLANFSKKDTWADYHFTFSKAEQFRENFNASSGTYVYVLPNKMNYPSKKEFLDDFQMCNPGAQFQPLLITSDYLFLIQSCTPWTGAENCALLHDIIKQTIKAK